MKIIDGKAIAANLRAEIAKEVVKLPQKPGLAVILVGDDPASQIYVRNKAKQTKEVGMKSFEYILPATISEDELVAKINELNNNKEVHGILVQLPLPKHISEEKVIKSILPEKDVDGFHPINVGLLTTGQDGLFPCTPLGCIKLIKSVTEDLSGLHAVVIGRSNIIGKPISQLLLRENCTVTITHSKTKNIKDICKQADILISAIGKPRMVKGNWIKNGAIVIDVGINRLEENGKSVLVGDVDFDEAYKIARAITPVPGGVGPMTIAFLLKNTLKAAKKTL